MKGWKRIPPVHGSRCEAITLAGYRCVHRWIFINANGCRFCGQHSASKTRFIAVGQRDFPPVSPNNDAHRIWLHVSFLMRRARGQIIAGASS